MTNKDFETSIRKFASYVGKTQRAEFEDDDAEEMIMMESAEDCEDGFIGDSTFIEEMMIAQNLPDDDDIEIRNETEEAIRKAEKVAIDGVEYIYQKIKESVVNRAIKRVREFRDNFKKPEYEYKKPRVEKVSNIPLILFFVILGTIAAGYVAMSANSYYIFSIIKGKSTDFGTVMWGCMLNTGYERTLSPFYMEIAAPAFLIVFGLVMIICFFAVTSANDRRRRRVGKEHGNARLAGSNDIKRFRKEFME